MHDRFIPMISLWCLFPYLDCLLNVQARLSHGLQQLIEAPHLLDKHRVHALRVSCGVSPHCSLNIKVAWEFPQNVTSDLI